MQNAVRLHNSLPSTKLENNMSPYQAFTGKLPNLGRFRVFGCVAWYYLPEHERSSKIGPRALPAINLGCDPERRWSNVSRRWDLRNRRTIRVYLGTWVSTANALLLRTWTIYFVLLQTKLLFSGFTGIS